MATISEERVHAALHELLAWPALARSPQLARFLSYIVESRLRGDAEGIKAYSIAVDVFGRPASFDPQTDPIVRVQARRLRALLGQYYAEGNGQSGVRIKLPVGRYVPEFASLEEAGPVSGAAALPIPEAAAAAAVEPPPKPTARRSPAAALIFVFAVVAMGGAALFVALRGHEPGAEGAGGAPVRPAVIVADFANLTGNAELDRLGTALADGLVGDLKLFEDIEARRGAADQDRAPDTFLVEGAISRLGQALEVRAMVFDSGGEVLWSRAMPSPAMGEASVMPARAFARDLAAFRGPLHAAGRSWLDAAARPLPAVSPYICLLTYRIAREGGSPRDIADAIACHERLLRETPDEAVGLASAAWLEAFASLAALRPGDDLSIVLAQPLERARRAKALRPGSSQVRESAAIIAQMLGDERGAREDLVAALGLNPLNTDARADYALALARSGEWTESAAQSRLALAEASHPPRWYYLPAALVAFEAGRFDEAMTDGRIAAQYSSGELGLLVRLAAAALAGRTDVVAEVSPRVLGSEILRRTGILAWLNAELRDPALLDTLAAGLRQAGIGERALAGPF